LNGANRANRRLNRAGRTAAPYGGKGLKTRANPMVAYSFCFFSKKEGKPIEQGKMVASAHFKTK
jgi:hypothetical protein